MSSLGYIGLQALSLALLFSLPKTETGASLLALSAVIIFGIGAILCEKII